ncbi:MAG: antibiotic biosynthesis monooxygenase [Rhodocyclaceae bacterium]|nr:antibiotic biosynthesis monooxygenase [Rhodocyclaceae bacterium]
MVIERVELLIKTGQESAFETAMVRGQALLASAADCRSVTIARGVENAEKFLLLLEWDSLTAHTNFTQTTEFAQFREIAGPFFAARPAMEHFSPVINLAA